MTTLCDYATTDEQREALDCDPFPASGWGNAEGSANAGLGTATGNVETGDIALAGGATGLGDLCPFDSGLNIAHGEGGLFEGDLGGGRHGEALDLDWGMGSWRDDQGRVNCGIGGDANLAGVGGQVDGGWLGPVDWNNNFVHGNFGYTHNEDTTTAGATFNLVDGDVAWGDENESTRLGGAIGFGANTRLHHGEDGKIGFGGDIGFASFDIKKTEDEWLSDLGRAALLGPFGAASLLF